MTKREKLPSTLVSVEGITASGRHGANPGERAEAQDFVIDLDVWIEAGADTLAGTVDYREIVEAARSIVASNSFTLLETLAEEVASAVTSLDDRIVRVTAVVHKPGAARSMGVGDVRAEATFGE